MKLTYTLFALAFFASPGFAAEMILQAEGQVTSIRAVQNSVFTAIPSGTINVGDVYTLSAVFDLDKAHLSPTFDAAPNVNIYYLPGTVVTLKVGSYNATFTPIFDFDSSVQIWNDRIVSGPTDSQSFSFFRYKAPSSEVPFDLGVGQVSYSTDFSAFDFTAQARTNDLVSQFASFDQFGFKSFSLGFLNSDSNLFVHVTGSVTSTRFISSAVPEPSSWITMIFGLGAIGFAMRRNPKLGEAPCQA